MKLDIQAKLEIHCIEFLRHKLGQFDTGQLKHFRLYDRMGQTARHGVWGRCMYPSRKRNLGYRIRCCVAINANEFPYPVKWSIGSRHSDSTDWEWVWREDRFQTLEEAFVWIFGHEAFHWLRHSRQIGGKNYETQANQYGFAWLDEWRAFIAANAIHGTMEVVHRNYDEKWTIDVVNTTMARLCYPDGRVNHFKDQQLAYAVWLALPKGVRVAFRGTNDARPVYHSDYADTL